MEKLLYDGRSFTRYCYPSEHQLRQDIMRHIRDILGPWVIYIDAQEATDTGGSPAPDGYLLDFSLEASPRLHIVEIELNTRDLERDIGLQLLRLSVFFRESCPQIMKFILTQLSKDENAMKIIKDAMQETGHKNLSTLLRDLAGQEPALLLILDEMPAGLEETLLQTDTDIECIIFQTFTWGTEHIHRYSTISDAWDYGEEPVSQPDTLIVPVGEADFGQHFIRDRCWNEVRIAPSRVKCVKYLAAYQTAPISAVTHYARVDRIEPQQTQGKFKVFFKYDPIPIEPLHYQSNCPRKLLRSPRYTYLERLLNAEFLEDLF